MSGRENEGARPTLRRGSRPKNISLGADAQARLEELRKKSRAASASEVIRNALRIYEFFVDETVSGTEFFMKRPSEQQAKIVIL